MSKLEELDIISKKLQDEFGEQLLSAIVYGSTLGDDYCVYSDFDILLIFDDVNFDTFKKIKSIKKYFEHKGILIDFNSHIYSDLPQVRKDLFWHNNRGLYVQKELALYGKVLFGPQYFSDFQLSKLGMLAEAVKVINSLNYQARKMLSNRELDTNNRIIMLKWCIYGVVYYLATDDIFPKSRKEALTIFNEKYVPKINPLQFLELKIKSPDNIKMCDIENAFNFLKYLDQMIMNKYNQRQSNGI